MGHVGKSSEATYHMYIGYSSRPKYKAKLLQISLAGTYPPDTIKLVGKRKRKKRSRRSHDSNFQAFRNKYSAVG